MPKVSVLQARSKIKVVGKDTFEEGEFILPLFVRRPTSIVQLGEWGADHNKSLKVDVEWTESNVSPRMEDTGIEVPMTHEITLVVKEEVRLPKEGADPTDWSGHEDLHPFWVMKRQREGDEINCELKTQYITVLDCYDWSDLQKQGARVDGIIGGNTHVVWYPMIVNTKRIREGQEIILKDFTPEEEKPDKKRKYVNAFDLLKSKEHKRQNQSR